MDQNSSYPYEQIRTFFSRTYPYNLFLDIAQDDVHRAMHMYPDGLPAALGLLDQRTQAILTSRYRDKETLQQIADEHGVTRERIRQISAKGVRRLRRRNAYALLAAVPAGAAMERDLAISNLEAERGALRIAYENLLHEKRPDDPPPIPDITLECAKDFAIDSLSLSVRAFNCLARADITTLGEVSDRTELDLLRIRNLGRGTVEEIKAVLARYGLALRPYDEQTAKTG